MADSGTKSAAERSIELLWGAGERPTRGPKPSLSLDGIVRTAIEIADTEGLDALSMQRLAKELGFTAMSLYRYVASKDELVILMHDAATGQPPGLAGPTWRADLESWAKGIVAVNRRHPWLTRVPMSGPPVGPNGLAWFESGLRALSAAGLRSDEMVFVATYVLGSVHGLVRLSADLAQGTPAEGSGYDAALAGVLTADRFPTLAKVFADRVFEPEPGQPDDWSNVDIELEFGLRRLMDGVESYVAARADRQLLGGDGKPAGGECGLADNIG